MAKYELMLIVNPSLADADRATTIENLKSILEKNSAKIEKEDIWWEKKLAYKINSSANGFYVLYDLDLDGKNIKTITNAVNLDKNIWRHMFVRKDV